MQKSDTAVAVTIVEAAAVAISAAVCEQDNSGQPEIAPKKITL
ncbi:MAG: hypothetical protein Q4F57_00045 [Weeksellaceae bacterium]|nr:hypothetical protein [Weeksellaceae bacterium]